MCDGYVAMRTLKIPKRTRYWEAVRWALGIWFVLQALYITIPDYPYGYRLWYWLTYDPNGYLHEMFYLATFYVVCLFLTYEFEKRSRVSRGR